MVQTTVIGHIYLGKENQEQYLLAGQLLPRQAKERLEEIAEKNNVNEFLRRLRGIVQKEGILQRPGGVGDLNERQ